MAKYTINTPIAEIIEDFKAANAKACNTPPVKQSLNWDEKFRGKTLGEMADAALTDPDFNPQWELWYLHYFGEQTEVNCRMKGLRLIKDPVMAFRIYRTYPWLSDEEDKLLEEKFKGKLPTAENELATGIVKRAKNG